MALLSTNTNISGEQRQNSDIAFVRSAHLSIHVDAAWLQNTHSYPAAPHHPSKGYGCIGDAGPESYVNEQKAVDRCTSARRNPGGVAERKQDRRIRL